MNPINWCRSLKIQFKQVLSLDSDRYQNLKVFLKKNRNFYIIECFYKYYSLPQYLAGRNACNMLGPSFFSRCAISSSNQGDRKLAKSGKPNKYLQLFRNLSLNHIIKKPFNYQIKRKIFIYKRIQSISNLVIASMIPGDLKGCRMSIIFFRGVF